MLIEITIGVAKVTAAIERIVHKSSQEYRDQEALRRESLGVSGRRKEDIGNLLRRMS